jgi:processive 1,2-diacylglycerol beta-glucosyltransferase
VLELKEEEMDMNSCPRIIILTASYGDGHLHASHALKQSFSKAGIDHVKIIDLMKEAHPILNKISTTLYQKSTITSRIGLDYYGWSYYMTRAAKPDTVWTRYFNTLGKKKLKEIVKQEQPDAIICTFPFGAAAVLCKTLKIPIFTVITDFSLHTRWLHPDINKYYVATEELKKQLIAKGILQKWIVVSGIPVRKQFDDYDENNPNEFVRRLAGNRKTVLILAGSYELKHIDGMIHSLQAVEGCQLAVVCGRNKKLEQALKNKYSNETHLHIFGFVENLHELMAISSCMITKAGGITLSEAIILKIPCFIFKPFAGQEKENAIFLSNKKVTSISNTTEELAFQIHQFLSEAKHCGEIKTRIDLIQKKSAADFIVRDIIHTTEQLNMEAENYYERLYVQYE